MRFLNLTRNLEIGANCYALDLAGKRVVLDCGLHPRQEGLESLPNLTAIPDDSVDAILLSHGHQDHVGAIPVLMRRHPRATLFSTEPTRQISDVMLHNSVNVMLRMREEAGVTEYPLFTHREADQCGKRWQAVPLHQRWSFDGERLGANEDAPLSFEFFDAGHILGSVGTLIRAEGRKIFYTGDVNFDDQTISSAARFPEEPLDVLIVETTRGDHETPPGFTRAKEELRLAGALHQAFERGGAVLIPVFALGKTQELLAMLINMQRQGLMPAGLPVYIGGLSAKLTEIYDKLAGQWPRQYAGMHLMDGAAPFVVNGRDIVELPTKRGRIYALTSGMMSEHTLSNIFASRMLSEPVQSLFFIGYADPASPGGRIRDAVAGSSVKLDEDQPAQPLRCNVDIFNFSAHASRESIRAWVNRVTPKKIILVHGEPSAIEWFRQAFQTDLPGSEVILPAPGEPLEL